MQTVVPGELRDKDGGILIYLRGSGTICFRTRESKGKWSYHDIIKGTRSGSATYSPVAFDQWHSVTLYPTVAKNKSVALELRTGKNASCNLWLDR